MQFIRAGLLLFFVVAGFYLKAQTRYPEFIAEGKASYYANLFHGKITASGEIFNNLDLTAAHLKLPFGTYVNVINKKNGHNVIVRINDRGPYIHHRIIDLSQAAMRRLQGFNLGVIPVKLYVLDIIHENDKLVEKFKNEKVINSLGIPSTLSGYTLSLWHTLDLIHAIYYANDIYLKEPVNEVLIAKQKSKNKIIYHVLLTGIESKEKLDELKQKFHKQGFERAREFNVVD
jgi:peptidoglycan lytic transglycosylase